MNSAPPLAASCCHHSTTIFQCSSVQIQNLASYAIYFFQELGSKNKDISENIRHFVAAAATASQSICTESPVPVHVISMHKLVTAVFDCLFFYGNNFIKAGKHATTVDYCGLSAIIGCKYGLRNSS